MDKAPDAFRTISEVADDLDIPQHVLRFWESRFAQIKPMKRAGGRRYYRPDDIDLLRGIRHLLYGEGYTIRGVQRILKEHGGKFVQSVWQAGAEQPQPAAEDFAPEQGGAALSPGEQPAAGGWPEPAIFRPSESEFLTASAPREATPRDAPSPVVGAQAPPDLPDKKLYQLQAVLDDLLECRQLLETSLGRSA